MKKWMWAAFIATYVLWCMVCVGDVSYRLGKLKADKWYAAHPVRLDGETVLNLPSGKVVCSSQGWMWVESGDTCHVDLTARIQ